MTDLIKRDDAPEKIVAWGWNSPMNSGCYPHECHWMGTAYAHYVRADRIEELEKELNISRMANVVMDNTVEELEAKLTECEARLGKAMEALRETGEVIIFHTDETSWRVWGEDVVGDIRTALAELEGKK